LVQVHQDVVATTGDSCFGRTEIPFSRAWNKTRALRRRHHQYPRKFKGCWEEVTSLYACFPFVWRLSSLMTRSNITILSSKLLTALNECVSFPYQLASLLRMTLWPQTQKQRVGVRACVRADRIQTETKWREKEETDKRETRAERYMQETRENRERERQVTLQQRREKGPWSSSRFCDLGSRRRRLPELARHHLLLQLEGNT